MKYAISGGHFKTIEAAQIILDKGGNAVDAAIAAYLVSFISEPCMASIGAGGFAMVNDKTEIKVIDFFCQTPLSKKSISQQEFFPITVDFGNTQEDFHVGKGSIAVPGAIAGIYAMHKMYGSIPMKELIEPAKLWAIKGITIDKFQAYDLHLLSNILKLDNSVSDVFFSPNGLLKKENDVIQMSDYSDFLEALSHEGSDLVYKGEISKLVSKDLKDSGHLTREDFEQYQPIIRKPIYFDFQGHRVYTSDFPSVGGMTLAAILNVFQNKIADKKIAPLSIHHFQELINTFAEVQKLKSQPRQIANYLINNFGISSNYNSNNKSRKWGGTSHFNIVDKKGMTVALTTSIGEGAGYFIPGTNMQMNNMLGEEALMPDGFHNWQENVRLQSMMSPTILASDSGITTHVLGSGGAARIPYALAQTIINLAYFNMPTEIATSSPRVHVSDEKIQVENGFDLDMIDTDSINTWEQKSLYFGGVNSITKKGNSYFGVADERRYGSVINEID